MSNTAVFFDRDGTLIQDPGYLNHPDQVQVIDGVAEALKEFQLLGYKRVVASNQSGVARGVVSVEMLERIAPETFGMPRAALLDEMERHNVRQVLGHKCTEILMDCVKVIDANGKEDTIEADTVCYSVGMKQCSETITLLKEEVFGVPVFEVGDCRCVGKVVNATESAYRVAMGII